MAKYKCLVCSVEAEIDTVARTKKFSFKKSRKESSFPQPGHTCELAKGIDHIDFGKLEKVG